MPAARKEQAFTGIWFTVGTRVILVFSSKGSAGRNKLMTTVYHSPAVSDRCV